MNYSGIVLILVATCASCTSEHAPLVSLSQVRALGIQGEFEGIFRPGQGVVVRYFFGITSKGNGGLELGSTGIRLYDSHDDCLYFQDFLLDQELVDVNSDGFLDLVLTGTAILTGEKETDPVSTRPIRSVFVYEPDQKTFKNVVPDEAVYVYTTIAR